MSPTVPSSSAPASTGAPAAATATRADAPGDQSLSFRRDHKRPMAWVLLLLAGLFLCAAGVALGLWQLNRLSWKTSLIERIEQRLQAAPVPAPGPAEWAGLDPAAAAVPASGAAPAPVTRGGPQAAQSAAAQGQAQAQAEYRRVRVTGRFAHELETLVTASTALGSGYWVLTPLRTEAGHWVLVNRGFVPPDKRDRAQRGERATAADAVVEINGLLRLTEPHGSALQKNQPAENRWYARDVAAMAQARGLGQPGREGAVAPYFVDAAAVDDAPLDWPRAGLTVLHFSNNHLMYALTWFTLAAMAAGALVYAVMVEHRAQLRRLSAAD